MRAILVRIGVDHSYGHWNAPVDPVTCEFVYVPIPDGEKKRYRLRCRRGYREILLWEFGSFGSTTYHMKNLLNPKHAKTRLEGARLAFAQGGPQGFKLVMLTPKVIVNDSKKPCEVRISRDGQEADAWPSGRFQRLPAKTVPPQATEGVCIAPSNPAPSWITPRHFVLYVD